MPPYQTGDWNHLAEQASKEMDSKKLMILVTQLNRVLEEQERAASPPKGPLLTAHTRR